jgi:hypothetical protein
MLSKITPANGILNKNAPEGKKNLLFSLKVCVK